MEKEFKCSNCPYSQVTENFFTRWCTYWKKVVYLISGCTREDEENNKEEN